MRVNQRATAFLAALMMLLNMPDAESQVLAGRSAGEISGRVYPDRPSSISYYSEEPRLLPVTDQGVNYLRMFLPGHHHTSETGKPELPVYSRLVEVPDGMELVVTLSDVVSRKIRLDNKGVTEPVLFPAQPARTKNESPQQKVTVKDRKAYEAREILSHDTVTVTHEGIFRGRRIANIAVYPAFYNPKGRYVDLITSMTLTIGYKPSATKGEDEGAIPFNKGGYASYAYIPGYSDKPVHMIIVTDSLFSRFLSPLIIWKNLKGIRTTVIHRDAGPPDTVFKYLKKSISDLYFSLQTKGIQVQYLLIAGDQTIIPTSRGTTNISDLYYGEFDGMGDYIPELFIGRLPASDTTQLKGMVKKIIDYETLNYLPENDFWSGALVTAGNAPGFELYMNGQVSYIYNNYLNQDTSLNAIRWLYPDSPQKDDSLKTVVNNGLSIINYTGHGEATGFSDPVLNTSMVEDLVNKNEYPFIIANACRTAQINVASCFATAMTATPEKGAIGYIGCTNDSYWSDDFFWAVGPGTPGPDVTYETTGKGAFDRLFHTHNEPPGEWYHTMGQINFSGNMSVSASTSPRKKYYWETYILLGDPSLSPVIGRPDTFDIELPDKVPVSLTSLDFFAKPFSYAAISDFDTLWDARHVSPSGNVSLAIPAGVKDSCLVVVTGQNMVPFYKTVHFGTVSEPFITVNNIVLDDSEGNGDGIPDYGESINLKVALKNIGGSATSMLNAQLLATSGMITVKADTATIGVLNPGETRNISGKFIFSVSDGVEDGELASLMLNLMENGEEYSFGIDLTLHAPVLKIVSAVHDDSSLGNANFLPDPGETICLMIRLKNEGSSAASGTVSVTPAGAWLTVAEPYLETDTLLPGEEKDICFEATVSLLAGSGRVIPYDIRFICGNYEASGRWSISTGKTRETWEFNRFDVFPWMHDEEYPWIITSATAYENIHSARSAPIPDKTESTLAIYVNNPVADTLSFYVRVSSEPTYDQLTFRVDSIVDMQISGDTPWALRKKVLKPGVHLLEWIYSKDVSLSGGMDAAWLDQVAFPDISFLEADLHIDTVIAPEPAAMLNDVTVKGRVINFGRNALTSFPLAYMVNDGDLVNETFYKKIDPGDTVEVSFTKKISIQKDVPYSISILGRLPEDAYAGNDTATVSFVISGTGPDLAEGILTVLPNPFKDCFTIEFDYEGGDNAEIELIDITGRVMTRLSAGLSAGKNRIPINCSHLPPGVYTLRLTLGGKSTSMRVVRQ
ncbi:MAG: T9SS type A sorting domain-containing protein [Bacteroidales bacterium]|nr:T9SS type A sorting domain-containing protein [Bacteroidales bacterium]